MSEQTAYAKRADDDREPPKMREFTERDHPNAIMLKNAHEAFQTGDMDALFSLFAEDMVWTVPGTNRLSGVYVGRDAIIGNFMTLAEVTDSYWAHPLDYFGSDDHVALVAEVRATRGDKRLDSHECLLFKVKDGRLASCHHMDLDPAEWDAFFK